MNPPGSHHNNNGRRPHALAPREDRWSEGATETLLEEWGDRYVKVNGGKLRQNDWKEVADAVNSRQDAVNGKKKKTDVQCKNRVDTLKKKYKTEKARLTPSKWAFYRRLDSLIGKPSTKPSRIVIRRSMPAEGAELSGGAACRELARAILRFGEVYERVESEKQRKIVELEKERMRLVRDVECERMNMLVVTQLEMLKKLKRTKPSTDDDDSGKKSCS